MVEGEREKIQLHERNDTTSPPKSDSALFLHFILFLSLFSFLLSVFAYCLLFGLGACAKLRINQKVKKKKIRIADRTQQLLEPKISDTSAVKTTISIAVFCKSKEEILYNFFVRYFNFLLIMSVSCRFSIGATN